MWRLVWVLFSLDMLLRRPLLLGIVVSDSSELSYINFANWRRIFAVTHILFETGSEALKDIEKKIYVGSGRFVLEEGKPVTVEYKISEVAAWAQSVRQGLFVCLGDLSFTLWSFYVTMRINIRNGAALLPGNQKRHPDKSSLNSCHQLP